MTIATTTVRLAVTAYASAANKADGVKLKTIDILEAEGVTPEMLKAPPKGECSAFYDSVKLAVIAAFKVADRRLLETPTKEVPADKKEDRRYLQQQIGSKVKDLRNALDRRLNPKVEGETAEKENSKKSAELQIAEALTAAIKKAQGLESPLFDVTAFVKHANGALSVLVTHTN